MVNNKDNLTAHSSKDYDKKINKTISYYSNFHNESINIIKIIKKNPKIWLDKAVEQEHLSCLQKKNFPE